MGRNYPDPVAIVTDVPSLTIPEGGQAVFNVKLAARPPEDIEITVVRKEGDSDILVASGPELKIKKRDYNKWHSVTLKALADADTTDGTAVISLSGRYVTSAEVHVTEKDRDVDLPSYEIVADPTTVVIPYQGTTTFGVRLSTDPKRQVSVTVGHAAGDAGITVVSGATLVFAQGAWATPQTVALAAADGHAAGGRTAEFSLSAPDAETVYVSAREEAANTTPVNVVIDPISRIEGHLRIEVEVAGGAVQKAWSTATLFRGIETILTGRDPLDAPLITQRLCGVCTYVHDLCSVRAIENAAGVTIPANARIVRNLMLGAQFLHDHLVHFYHLHGLDWVDITSALAADPDKTATLAWEIAPENVPIPVDFAAVRARLQGLVDTGNLGPFANAYWGHSAYRLSPEENLLVTAHYLEALKMQVTAAKMMAILGGKNPHPQSTIVGGVTCGGELTAERLGDFRAYLAAVRSFIDAAYIPDLKVVAERYPDWKSFGRFGNFMACGEFPQGPDWPGDLFMPEGMIFNGEVRDVQPLDPAMISEHVARSWYAGTTARHPVNGETVPEYTGLDKEARYSWLKAPRYGDDPMEVGPLARVLVGYGRGVPVFVDAVENFLTDVGLSEADLLSTLGRTAARAIETVIIGTGMVSWLKELEDNLIISGDKQIYEGYSLGDGPGVGFLEAPRGALGHWIDVSSGKIGAYQMVVPTTWNLSPRCGMGFSGPLEKALVGVPVADPENPVEVLRVIHSYDPCIACGVHVIDTERNETFSVKVGC